MKKISTWLVFTLMAVSVYSSASFTGLSGGIDFPNAYVLMNKNYTVSGIISSLNDDVVGDFVLETGLIPQVEAGLKVSTLNEKVDQTFLQSNVKFQLVSEGEGNPAIAIGFAEFDSYQIQGDEDEESEAENFDAYAFLAASKSFKIRNNSYNGTLGVMYSQKDDSGEADVFGILEIPVFDKIKLITEGYSYEKSDSKKASINIAAEFVTKENVRTKVYWRERNNSFGVSVHYISLFNQ